MTAGSDARMDRHADAERAEAYFRIGSADLEALSLLGIIVQDVRETLINELYELMLSWEDARKTLAAVDLEKAKEAQRGCFEELFSGTIDEAYVARRRKIGAIHDEKNVSPVWYLAGYAFYLNRLYEFLLPRLQGRPAQLQLRVIQALSKVVLFDAALAWEEYTLKRDQRRDGGVRFLAMQQNMMLAELKRMEQELIKPAAEAFSDFQATLAANRAALPPDVRKEFSRIEQRMEATMLWFRQKMAT